MALIWQWKAWKAPNILTDVLSTPNLLPFHKFFTSTFIYIWFLTGVHLMPLFLFTLMLMSVYIFSKYKQMYVEWSQDSRVLA